MADIVLERRTAGRGDAQRAARRSTSRTGTSRSRRQRSAGQTGRRARRGTERTSRILLLVIALLALILIGELAFHFVLAPELSISEISVESDIALSDAELLQAAGLEQAPAYFSVDTANVASNLESHPSVRSATVEKVFPNRLQISIAGRKPLLLTLAERGGTMVPVAVDEEGIVFEPEVDLAALDLPLVSGIRFEGFTPGVQLPAMLTEFLADVRALKMDHPVLFDQISEYRIVRTGDHSFEVVLYPVDYGTPVRIGSEVDGSLCTYIIMVLDAFERDGRLDEIEEFDFRTGEIVYRTKEG